jgi:hypothetical protein
MSFQLSFHQALLGPSGAYWLDDPPDLGCQDGTGQHSVDGCQLSCKPVLRSAGRLGGRRLSLPRNGR